MLLCWKNLSYQTRNVEEVELDSKDVEDGRAECIKCLIGKVMGERTTNFTGIKNFVNNMWGFPRKMVATEVGVNLYQFTFSGQKDIDRILARRPYVIANQLLNIKQWEEDIDYNPEAFNVSHLWVQIWNMSIHWLTKEIGRVFNKVEDMIILVGGSKDGRHLRIKAEVDIRAPLLRGTT